MEYIHYQQLQSLSQQMSCFCICHVTEKFQVTINNKSIISVDSVPPDTQWHAHLMTVDDTFNRVLYLIKQDPYKININTIQLLVSSLPLT